MLLLLLLLLADLEQPRAHGGDLVGVDIGGVGHGDVRRDEEEQKAGKMQWRPTTLGARASLGL